MSDKLLHALDDSGRHSALDLLASAREAGIPVVVVSGVRTLAEQKALAPGSGLYKANDPAQSRHVQRRAFDLGVSGIPWRQVDPAVFRELGRIWKDAGGRWGGDFSRPDPVHFDW